MLELLYNTIFPSLLSEKAISVYKYLDYKIVAGVDFEELLLLSESMFSKELKGKDVFELVNLDELKDTWDTLCAQSKKQIPAYSSLASCLIKGFPGTLNPESVSLIAPGDLYTVQGEQKFNHKNSYIAAVSVPHGEIRVHCACVYDCFNANNSDILSSDAYLGDESYSEDSKGTRFFLDTGLDENEVSKAQELFDKSRQDYIARDNARWLISNIILGVFPVWVINDDISKLRRNADNFVKNHSPLPGTKPNFELGLSPLPVIYEAKDNNYNKFSSAVVKEDKVPKYSNQYLEELFCRIRDTYSSSGYIEHAYSASEVLVNIVKLQELTFLTAYNKIIPNIDEKVDSELLSVLKKRYSWAACNVRALNGSPKEVGFRDSIHYIFKDISYHADRLLSFYEPQLSKFYMQIADKESKEDIGIGVANKSISVLNSYLNYLSAIANSPEINAVIVDFENIENKKKQKIQDSKDAWSAIASSGLNF